MAEPIFFLGLMIFFSIAIAFDGPLQDFCVADLQSTVRINGFACKSPEKVEANDFFFSGLHLPANTSSIFGTNTTTVTVNEVPGLNTLGLSIARVDFAKDGFNPPHIHQKASEIVLVLDGSLQIGFVTSNPNYTQFIKTLYKCDAFAVPAGLVHYGHNVGNGTATAIIVWNSEVRGTTLLNKAIFGAKPDINSDFLAQFFFLDKKIVEQVQNKFR